MTGQLGNALRNTAAVSVGLLLALLAGEVVTRTAAGPPAWFLFTGSFRDRRTGFDVEYHVTDHMRRVTCDPRGEEGDGRTRIAVIGDSFVFGQGVPDCRDFVALLDRRQAAVHFENFGIIGGGPAEYRLVARDLLDETYDGVLVVFYGNDFPILGPAGERSLLGTLADHSSVFALLRKAKRGHLVDARLRQIEETGLGGSHIEVFNNLAAMIKGPSPAYARLCAEPGDEAIAAFEDDFDAIIRTLERRIPRDRITIAMVPPGSVVSRALRRFIVDLGGEVAPFGERGTAYRVVERLAGQYGLRFIDTFDAFLERGDAGYWHDDLHWSEPGHQQMAELVARAFSLPEGG